MGNTYFSITDASYRCPSGVKNIWYSSLVTWIKDNSFKTDSVFSTTEGTNSLACSKTTVFKAFSLAYKINLLINIKSTITFYTCNKMYLLITNWLTQESIKNTFYNKH